uniref:Uncharacterized protein n=1 Tax=Hanusia phi TaxID=3032 RepID=A0A7S0HVA2_9CRYP
MKEISSDVDNFYNLSEGHIEYINHLFSEMAGQMIPPPTVFELLGVDPKSFAGKVPIATKEQFVNAIHKSIDDSDTVDQYKKVLNNQTTRLSHAKKVLGEIKDTVNSFHQKVGGDLAKIEGLFCSMAPEPNTGKPMPPGMVNALLRVSPEAKTCSAEELLACFERNLDPSDTSEELIKKINQYQP